MEKTINDIGSCAAAALIKWHKEQQGPNWEQNTQNVAKEAEVIIENWHNALQPFYDQIGSLTNEKNAILAKYNEQLKLKKDAEQEAESYFEKYEIHRDGQTITKKRVPAGYAVVYADAIERARVAAEKASAYCAENNRFESQINQIENQIRAKCWEIESFVLEVYGLKSMNNNDYFLSYICNRITLGAIDFSEKTKALFQSRKFYVDNEYRPHFDKFENTINTEKHKYEKAEFIKEKDKLEYTAERNIIVDKLKASLKIQLLSTGIYEATLSYISTSKFVFPGRKAAQAIKDVTAAKGMFDVASKKNTVTISVNKEFINSEIDTQINRVAINSEKRFNELTNMLQIVSKHGGRMCLALWKKLIILAVCLLLVLGLIIFIKVKGLI